MDGAAWLGRQVEVCVEIPRGGKVKYRSDGTFDYASPIGAPFNYGALPGVPGGDGDELDAILLGPTVARGARVQATVVGVVLFTDRGAVDDKLVCTTTSLGWTDRALVSAFFGLLTPVRRGLYWLRGEAPGTRVRGILWYAASSG